jgi:hypothetical protein
MKILLSKTGYWRKPELRIRTDIIKQKNNIFVTKTALGSGSKEILNRTVNEFHTIDKLLPKNTHFARPINNKLNTFAFEYAKGQTLERLIEDALIEKKFDEATALFNRGIDIIMSLPSEKRTINQEKKFMKFFSLESKYGNQNMDFVTIPIVELTADHIFCNGNKNTIIDYEIFFDFTVPKEFLLFRYKFHLINTLQQVIGALISNEFKATSFFQGLLIPIDWNKNLPIPNSRKEMYINLEKSIQNYLNSNENNKLEFYTTSTEIINVRTFPKLSHHDVLLMQNPTQMKQKIRGYEDELNMIKDSKFYKIWRMYSIIKDKLL